MRTALAIAAAPFFAAACTPPTPPAPIATCSAFEASAPESPVCRSTPGATPGDAAPPCDPCTTAGEGGARHPIALHLAEGSFLMGVASLDVDPRGMATWSKRGPMPDAGVEMSRAQLSPAELAALERTLRDHHLCAQRSARYGIPDEARIIVTACLPAVKCEIAMWDGEWEHQPDAKASLDAIHALIDGIVRRGGDR